MAAQSSKASYSHLQLVRRSSMEKIDEEPGTGLEAIFRTASLAAEAENAAMLGKSSLPGDKLANKPAGTTFAAKARAAELNAARARKKGKQTVDEWDDVRKISNRLSFKTRKPKQKNKSVLKEVNEAREMDKLPTELPELIPLTPFPGEIIDPNDFGLPTGGVRVPAKTSPGAYGRSWSPPPMDDLPQRKPLTPFPGENLAPGETGLSLVEGYAEACPDAYTEAYTGAMAGVGPGSSSDVEEVGVEGREGGVEGVSSDKPQNDPSSTYQPHAQPQFAPATNTSSHHLSTTTLAPIGTSRPTNITIKIPTNTCPQTSLDHLPLERRFPLPPSQFHFSEDGASSTFNSPLSHEGQRDMPPRQDPRDGHGTASNNAMQSFQPTHPFSRRGQAFNNSPAGSNKHAVLGGGSNAPGFGGGDERTKPFESAMNYERTPLGTKLRSSNLANPSYGAMSYHLNNSNTTAYPTSRTAYVNPNNATNAYSPPPFQPFGAKENSATGQNQTRFPQSTTTSGFKSIMPADLHPPPSDTGHLANNDITPDTPTMSDGVDPFCDRPYPGEYRAAVSFDLDVMRTVMRRPPAVKGTMDRGYHLSQPRPFPPPNESTSSQHPFAQRSVEQTPQPQAAPQNDRFLPAQNTKQRATTISNARDSLPFTGFTGSRKKEMLLQNLNQVVESSKAHGDLPKSTRTVLHDPMAGHAPSVASGPSTVKRQSRQGRSHPGPTSQASIGQQNAYDRDLLNASEPLPSQHSDTPAVFNSTIRTSDDPRYTDQGTLRGMPDFPNIPTFKPGQGPDYTATNAAIAELRGPKDKKTEKERQQELWDWFTARNPQHEQFKEQLKAETARLRQVRDQNSRQSPMQAPIGGHQKPMPAPIGGHSTRNSNSGFGAIGSHRTQNSDSGFGAIGGHRTQNSDSGFGAIGGHRTQNSDSGLGVIGSGRRQASMSNAQAAQSNKAKLEAAQDDHFVDLMGGVISNFRDYTHDTNPDYFSFGAAPAWAVDNTPGGNKSFFEKDWGHPPQRVGRDPRYQTTMHEGRPTYFQETPNSGPQWGRR